jgi:hypothetical protein
MTDPEKPTHEQALRDAINTDAGVVNTNALVAYLESRREDVRKECMRWECTERSADRMRGVNTLAGQLIAILTNPNPETP